MKGEIPVCTRCCFCLPLRRGLLAWGYVKLIADVVFILMMLYITLFIILIFRAFTNDSFGAFMCTEVIMGFIGILLCLVDFVITVVYIVGAHKKNVKLIRVFYIHSMVVCVISAILSVLAIVVTIQVFVYDSSLQYVGTIVVNVATCLGILVLQCYFVLLLRSEIIKLRSNCEFRFVNNAAEAECSMRCANDLAKEHNMAEPVLERVSESEEEIVTTDHPV